MKGKGGGRRPVHFKMAGTPQFNTFIVFTSPEGLVTSK